MAPSIFTSNESQILKDVILMQMEITESFVRDQIVAAQESNEWEHLGNLTVKYFELKGIYDTLNSKSGKLSFDECVVMVPALDSFLEIQSDMAAGEEEWNQVYTAVAILAKLKLYISLNVPNPENN